MSSTNRSSERDRRLAANPLDFYETPAECVADLAAYLPELAHMPGAPQSAALILDAGCGTGAIGLGLLDHLAVRRGPVPWKRPNVVGVECDEARAAEAEQRGLAVVRGDFTTLAASHVDHVVGNPPFNEALAFIRTALSIVREGGLVAFLLRLNFLGSGTKRADVLVEGSGIFAVFVMTDRPSFCTSAACKACRGTWQFKANQPLSEALHPPSTRDIEPCPHVGARPNAKGPYRAGRTDSCDYAWVVWKKGHTGPAKLVVIPTHKNERMDTCD